MRVLFLHRRYHLNLLLTSTFFCLLLTVAGRVHSKRGQGKLMFYDIHGEGVKIQIMSDISSYEGGEDAFREVHNLVKRGDIVGVRGFPGKSKKGELSIFPQSMVLLSPCLHMLPKGHTGLKNQEVRSSPHRTTQENRWDWISSK